MFYDKSPGGYFQKTPLLTSPPGVGTFLGTVFRGKGLETPQGGFFPLFLCPC